MANRRDLKKDIKFVAGELLWEAFDVAAIASEEATKEIMGIISEITEMYNVLIIKVNHIKDLDDNEVRPYVKGIVQDLLTKSNDFYSRIGKAAEA